MHYYIKWTNGVASYFTYTDKEIARRKKEGIPLYIQFRSGEGKDYIEVRIYEISKEEYDEANKKKVYTKYKTNTSNSDYKDMFLLVIAVNLLPLLFGLIGIIIEKWSFIWGYAVGVFIEFFAGVIIVALLLLIFPRFLS